MVFTTRYGTPIEPRNFTRAWDARVFVDATCYVVIAGQRETQYVVTSSVLTSMSGIAAANVCIGTVGEVGGCARRILVGDTERLPCANVAGNRHDARRHNSFVRNERRDFSEADVRRKPLPLPSTVVIRSDD